MSIPSSSGSSSFNVHTRHPDLGGVDVDGVFLGSNNENEDLNTHNLNNLNNSDLQLRLNRRAAANGIGQAGMGQAQQFGYMTVNGKRYCLTYYEGGEVHSLDANGWGRMEQIAHQKLQAMQNQNIGDIDHFTSGVLHFTNPDEPTLNGHWQYMTAGARTPLSTPIPNGVQAFTQALQGVSKYRIAPSKKEHLPEEVLEAEKTWSQARALITGVPQHPKDLDDALLTYLRNHPRKPLLHPEILPLQRLLEGAVGSLVGIWENLASQQPQDGSPHKPYVILVRAENPNRQNSPPLYLAILIDPISESIYYLNPAMPAASDGSFDRDEPLENPLEEALRARFAALKTAVNANGAHYRVYVRPEPAVRHPLNAATLLDKIDKLLINAQDRIYLPFPRAINCLPWPA